MSTSPNRPLTVAALDRMIDALNEQPPLVLVEAVTYLRLLKAAQQHGSRPEALSWQLVGAGHYLYYAGTPCLDAITGHHVTLEELEA